MWFLSLTVCDLLWYTWGLYSRQNLISVFLIWDLRVTLILLVFVGPDTQEKPYIAAINLVSVFWLWPYSLGNFCFRL